MHQLGFSSKYPEMYNLAGRKQKANKIITVLKDYFGNFLSEKKLLDVGCSTGIMTNLLASEIQSAEGIDIDENAIQYAEAHRAPNVHYSVRDAAATELPANEFDIVICAHVYEHVPDARALLKEIHRVLKPGGVCFFAAGNRYRLIEGHYHLPLLSALPKFIGNYYLRIMRKGDLYYENHLSYWNLKKLVKEFKIIDYTKKIIIDPVHFAADDMVRPSSVKQRLALLLCNIAYPFVPTYIWLLRKSGSESTV